MLPDALKRQGDGWKLSVRIRLVHARVRRLIRTSGDWDEAVYGAPLSAAHLALASANFSATREVLSLPLRYPPAGLHNCSLGNAVAAKNAILHCRRSSAEHLIHLPLQSGSHFRISTEIVKAPCQRIGRRFVASQEHGIRFVPGLRIAQGTVNSCFILGVNKPPYEFGVAFRARHGLFESRRTPLGPSSLSLRPADGSCSTGVAPPGPRMESG